ncbi:MAG: hydrolase 2, exosortase A system-associated [Pseudomonadota bacterium]
MAPPAEPFFLGSGAGARFCLFHRPAGPVHAAVLYVAPYGEEMNCARRMSQQLARALAARGVAVLVIDLHGCGDSAGDSGEAHWDSWLADLAAGCDWIVGQTGVVPALLGVRLGALLALDYARQASHRIDKVVLWQPVASGAAFLSQLLRQRVASEMLNGAAPDAQTGDSGTLEIAGYELAPALAKALGTLQIGPLLAPDCAVHWFEIVPEAGRAVAPGTARLLESRRQQGPGLHFEQLVGAPFWALPGAPGCPALIEASCAVFEKVRDAV